MSKNSAILVPSSPGLSTVQILASTTFAPIGFVFPTDGHDKQAVQKNLQYAWKEIRRWHRSFSILCDEAEDADILHVFHLLVSSLFIILDELSSDSIDKSIRSALQPLREWAGTVIRTEQEYRDFMRNVRVSMLCLYETLQEVGVSQLSSSRQIAEVNTSMDEVAIFLKLRPLEPEVSDTQEEVKENVQTKPAGPAKKKGFVARFLHKLRHIS